MQLQPAYVLHQRPYRDSSLLLEIFSLAEGRLSMVGKGVRRRSRGGSNAALLRPFVPLLVSCSGRGELKTLTRVEAAGTAPDLRGEHLYSGLYLNELLVRLLHKHDPHPALFAAYGEALGALGESGAPEPVLRRFEFGLLDELGYSFSLCEDGRSGEALRPGGWYLFEPQVGLVEARSPGEGSRHLFSGADLQAVARGDYAGPAGLAAKRLARQALAAHLGVQPLKSRELFRAFARGTAGGQGE